MTLTGTGSITTGSRLVHGTGTSFTTELVQGDVIHVGSYTGTVDEVQSDTTVKCKEKSTVDASGTVTKD